MKHYPKIKNLLKTEMFPTEEILIGEVSVTRLMDDCLTALYREVKNLLISSAKGKLSTNDARDLRENLKMLFELKDREANLLRNLSDADLMERAKLENIKD